MSIYEAWASGQPIYERLPDAYKENEIAKWLSDFWDELLIATKGQIDEIPDYLAIADSTPEDWLDFLAPLCGFTGGYWDRSWPIQSKVTLLRNAYTFIWVNKGSKAVLSFVLTALGIQNFVQVAGDFIIGTDQVGDPLGINPWEYVIILPESYRNTDKHRLAQKIDRLYGPAWCKSNILFDDERFRIIGLIGTDEDKAIATNNDEVFETLE
ncbi:MAG: hypothetical protein ACFE0I_02510 [Elainellaceae cyanobacterium]